MAAASSVLIPLPRSCLLVYNIKAIFIIIINLDKILTKVSKLDIKI